MKRICCRELWDALIRHEGGLEWTPVSEGDAAGPVVVGRMVRHSAFCSLHWCPYCGEAI